MPNWVKNKLFIHGPSDMVKQCTLDIASEDEHISFEKILPKPKDIGDGWYDWCIENWGVILLGQPHMRLFVNYL